MSYSCLDSEAVASTSVKASITSQSKVGFRFQCLTRDFLINTVLELAPGYTFPTTILTDRDHIECSLLSTTTIRRSREISPSLLSSMLTNVATSIAS